MCQGPVGGMGINCLLLWEEFYNLTTLKRHFFRHFFQGLQFNSQHKTGQQVIEYLQHGRADMPRPEVPQQELEQQSCHSCGLQSSSQQMLLGCGQGRFPRDVVESASDGDDSIWVRTLVSPRDISCVWDENTDDNDGGLGKVCQQLSGLHTRSSTAVSRVAPSAIDVHCEPPTSIFFLFSLQFMSTCTQWKTMQHILLIPALSMWAPRQPESLQLPGHPPTA